MVTFMPVKCLQKAHKFTVYSDHLQASKQEITSDPYAEEGYI